MPVATAIERLRLSTRTSLSDPAISQPWLCSENQQAFRTILDERRLDAVFQPILDFRARRYFGFEGLVRGPADTPLRTPAVLFGLARTAGLSIEFESLCREIILTEFARRKLSGLLFLNASISALADPKFINGKTAALLDELHLRPQDIVIELTENQHVADFHALREVLDVYRGKGYRIAVDDLGEGFSNLRIWSEVRPDFIKIDRHFISGIADDNLKFQLVRAMHEIAESNRVHLIAEGIETEAEFATVRDLGICYGQGYLIARPEALPRQQPLESVMALVQRGSVIVFPRAVAPSPGPATARQLLTRIAPIHRESDNECVIARFEQDPGLLALPVVDPEWRPVGMINRYSMIDRFAMPFRRELYGRRPCTLFMDDAPIVVDHATGIQDISQLIGQSAQQQMMDGFIVTEAGRYIGTGSSHALMALITDMQIRAARYANPLTQLPGNVPINEHLDRLVTSGTAFVACYCDLDHFKPYNDTYGYRRGDELIQFLGNLLTECCDLRIDFVGHIGGDDFMLVLQSGDWQQRVTRALRAFDEQLPAFVAPDHVREGGYTGEDRLGRPVFHPLPALSIGCLVAGRATFRSHHEVSAAVGDVKKQAKKTQGSSMFIERRRAAPTRAASD
ncbi:MAG: GGDEF domain-containing protein [Rhodocyclales bacterium]|nr:GGDEF domain-containing protein [Rhodocyclales bacterium]